MTNHVFSEITKFKFKIPITSRSATYNPLQGSPSSRAVSPALVLTLLAPLMSMYRFILTLSSLPGTPSLSGVHQSNPCLPSVLPLTHWVLRGPCLQMRNLSDVTVTVLPMGRHTCWRLKYLCFALPVQALAFQITELAGVLLRRAKDSPLSADLFRSTALSIIFKALSC